MDAPTSKFGFSAGYPDPEGVQSIQVLLGDDTSDTAFVTKAYVDARAGGSVTIPVDTNEFADGAVTTPKLDDAAVTTGKITDLGVTSTNIANSAVTTAKIASTTVATTNFGSGTVTTAKFATGAATSGKFGLFAVTTAKIADDNVTADKLASNSITSFANSSVTTAKFGTSAVTSLALADSAVTTTKIQDGAVQTADIESSPTITNAVLENFPQITTGSTLRFTNTTVSDAMNINVFSGSGATRRLDISYSGGIGAATKTLRLNTSTSTANENFFQYRDPAAGILQVFGAFATAAPAVMQTGKVASDVEDTLVCDLSGTTVAVIEDNGDTYNANGNYLAISDERIKENIVSATSQWEDVKRIRFVKYRLRKDIEAIIETIKASEAIPEEEPGGDEPEPPFDSHYMIGVIAQELEESGLGGLVETTNGLKTVKTSVLQMKCLVALQELVLRIEALESKVE